MSTAAASRSIPGATPQEALAGLWTDLGLPQDVLGRISLHGGDPVLPSSFRIGTAAAASIGAVALAAAELHRRRTGAAQEVAVNLRHAGAEFRSERYLRVDGGPAPELWDAITGAYPCGDGRWVRIHTNFPHHRDGILRLLGCHHERASVADALRGWEAAAVETAAAEAGLVVAMLRTISEWDLHPQGMAVAAAPLVALTRTGDAPPRRLGPGERPLSGLRILDLTRIIAGPVCGRALAAHGAEVLRVIAPGLPTAEPLDIDSGRGKRSAFLDLDAPGGPGRMTELVRGADVVVQSYRPGTLAARGFGPEALAALRPGIVTASLSAYGTTGPWSGRRGFDSLVQAASGFNRAEAEAAGQADPRPLPAQALDHGSGYLLALGIMAALLRQAEEGGSRHVAVSLAGTGHWLRSLGRVEDGFAVPDQSVEDVADLLEESPSGWGRLTAVRHAARMSATPPGWERPSVPFGTDEAAW